MLEPVESPPHAGELSAAAPLGVAALLAAGAGSRYIAAGGVGSHKLLALVDDPAHTLPAAARATAIDAAAIGVG